MLTKFALIAVVSLGSSFGATIVASGAGPLPSSAQNLTANKNVTAITGTLDFPYGVNMFALNIVNYLDFSAITVPVGAFGVPDTELFLFDSTGRGVYGNDDINNGSNTFSCLPSADAANPCPYGQNGVGPKSNGIYYLAITRSANGPLSNSGEIFTGNLAGAVAGPDLTQGGGSPVTGYDNGVYTQTDFDNVNYRINFTGLVPEPATWALLSVSLLALPILRRKQRAAR